MNDISIIRQLKIDMITDTHNDTIAWFNDLWSKITVVEIDVYHKNGGEFIYYFNNDVVFFRDENLNIFRFSFKYYLNPLIRLQGYDYFHNGNKITDILIDNVMDIKVTSTPFSSRGLGLVRKVLKNYMRI